MPLLQLLLVAVIQGITEFLPVSSSGHLILLPALSGMEDQGQVIDAAVHVGTLAAVMVYLRAETGLLFTGLADWVRGRRDTRGAQLIALLFIATLPVIVFGVFLKATGWDEAMRSATVIGWTMLLFGLVLYWSDRIGPAVRTAQNWSSRHALILGFWQALALIPGTSRSGITITGARFLGYTRTDAARLSMLMSVPTILATGTFVGVEVASTANAAQARDGAIAAVFAFGAALVALVAMMRLLQHVSFTPYVIYRVVLGLLLLGFAA